MASQIFNTKLTDGTEQELVVSIDYITEDLIVVGFTAAAGKDVREWRADLNVHGGEWRGVEPLSRGLSPKAYFELKVRVEFMLIKEYRKSERMING